MSDKKDEINKKNEQDLSKVERTQDLVDYVYAKEYLSMVESEKGKAKMMVSDEMVEYVLAKLRLWHDKGKTKQEEHDLDDVDIDHVDLNGLALENRVKKLEDDFSRMLITP
ncbi:hypothetical protein Tco_1266498 [Tanacetum coccineum]